MKVSASVIAAVVAMAAHDAQGFASQQQLRSGFVGQGRVSTVSLKMAEESEIDKLRAAAARAREEAARLAKVRKKEVLVEKDLDMTTNTHTTFS